MRVLLSTLACTVACGLAASSAGASPLQLVVGRAVIELQAPDGYAQVQLTLVSPDGGVIEASYPASTARLQPAVAALIDGAYRYRLSFAGPRSAATATEGDSEATEGRHTLAQSWPELNGQFGLRGQELLTANEPTAAHAEPDDQIIADDLIAQGGLCVGLDCVDGENFSFITTKMKENNIRLQFDDSTSTGTFPARDWQILINDTNSGGADKFAIEDLTAGRVPFTILGNAPNHALFVDAAGRLGLGTATPVLQLHQSSADTPAMRMEQNGGGFTPQTWDIAGNEANFFVRDVTGGSRLPFRIRPGAPTSSIDINSAGQVGVGTASPSARIHVQQNAPLAEPVVALKVRNNDASVPAGTEDRFTVDSAGNVTARGTISQLSSRSAKEHFEEPPAHVLLARLETLRVPSWSYIGAAAGERHIGPVAEEFHAAFQVGGDPRFLAPADVAGVALASVKALQSEVQARDARIAELEQRLLHLEILLEAQR